MTLEDLCFVNLRVTVSNLSFNTPHSSWSFSATSPANIISKYTISINKSSCTLLLPRFPLLGPTKCGRSSVAPPPLDQHHRYLIAHWCHLFNYCSLLGHTFSCRSSGRALFGVLRLLGGFGELHLWSFSR